MKIPFDIILENPHIITDSQIKVLALGKGPKNVVLSSKYSNRDSEDYLESLGQIILHFAKIVPHGLLVFFPSYRALDVTAEYWKVIS
jgi:regulator of telomere elongation helicase 1